MLMRATSMNQAATQAVVALLHYKNDHGQFPTQLDALLPNYLKAIPLDIFSGKPLKYSLNQEGQMQLYSLGRNMLDDGGSTEMIEEPRHPQSPQVQVPADIVYWPPKTK
jgi:hypothetical protein